MERAAKVDGVSFAAAMLFAALPAFAATKADFLVVGEVRPLFVYNQYQQRLSSEEKGAFPLFSPFRILDGNMFLGDGFTPCLKVGMNSRVYFFEKDSNGQIAGGGSAALQLYRNAASIGDTVEVLRNDRVTFSDPLQRKQPSLARGTRVVRIFRHQGLTYVMTLGSAARFGWARLESGGEGREWMISKNAGLSLPARLENALPQVQLKLREANAKFIQLFELFNRESSLQRRAPEWKAEVKSDSIVCVLVSETPPDAFAESSQALAKSVEGVLLGSGLRVVAVPGRMVISGGRR